MKTSSDESRIIKVCFFAQEAQELLRLCKQNRHDRLWLVRSSRRIELTPPDQGVSIYPGYIGKNCLSLYTDHIRPAVEVLSTKNSLLKVLTGLPDKKAGATWLEFHFDDQNQYRMFLITSATGTLPYPGDY